MTIAVDWDVKHQTNTQKQTTTQIGGSEISVTVYVFHSVAASRPTTSRQILPDMTQVYSFETGTGVSHDLTQPDSQSCSCLLM